MNWKRIEVFFEFLIFGIAVGVAEDLLTLKVVADEPITRRVIGIVVFIAIPFATLGELLVDRIDFIRIFKKLFKKEGSQ